MNPHAPTPRDESQDQPSKQRADDAVTSDEDATLPTESQIDRALIETFPASNPVAVHSEATPSTPLPHKGRRFSMVWTLRWPWRDEPKR